MRVKIGVLEAVSFCELFQMADLQLKKRYRQAPGCCYFIANVKQPCTSWCYHFSEAFSSQPVTGSSEIPIVHSTKLVHQITTRLLLLAMRRSCPLLQLLGLQLNRTPTLYFVKQTDPVSTVYPVEEKARFLPKRQLSEEQNYQETLRRGQPIMGLHQLLELKVSLLSR